MVSHVTKGAQVKNGAVCYIKHSLPLLDEPKNLRIKFSKTGSLQYISHLDLQRLFGRAAVRAGIPLWYTQGFNPHPKMVFALPLPVGVQSVCEFLDVKIDKAIDDCDVADLLNRVLTDEMKILEVYEPDTKFADIASADYEIVLKTPGASETLAASIKSFITGGGVIMKKHTKSGEKEIDITDMVLSFDADYNPESGCITVKARCVAGAESLNPEYIISSLKQYEVLPKVSLLEESYSIMRLRVLRVDGSEFK